MNERNQNNKTGSSHIQIDLRSYFFFFRTDICPGILITRRYIEIIEMAGLRKKTKETIGRPEHSLTHHPLLPLASHFLLSRQPRPSFQNWRHMCITPK